MRKQTPPPPKVHQKIKPHLVRLKSLRLTQSLDVLDDQLSAWEYELSTLRKANTKLQRKMDEQYYEKQEESRRQVNESTGNVLKILMGGYPTAASLGSVGATMFARICDMKSQEEVQAYLRGFEDSVKNETDTLKSTTSEQHGAGEGSPAD